MFTHIRKRDGRLAAFDAKKIAAAIENAGRATGEFGPDTAWRLAQRVVLVAERLLGEDPPGVEAIQDIVEDTLLDSPFRKSTKAYIIYRDQHARIRDIVSKGRIDLVDNYLKALDWQVNENSNMAYSLQGLNHYVASEVTKAYWLNSIYSSELRDAHLSGDLHVHDLNQLSVYCVGWDLRDLLMSGFQGAPGKAESSPARHLGTALGQVTNFFYTLQGEAAGAQAFANFDTFLAPFIRYDGLTYEEVKQELQEFLFNVNVPTRVGFQTPFTNITMDLTVPSTYAREPVIIGGSIQDACYGDFQEEMNLFNRAFLEVMTEGDAKGRVFTFPIPTYNIGKDFDWDNPVLDGLWDVTARYGIPYFANFVNSDMSPEDARSMCCRLRLDMRKLDHRGGGLFGANPLTGSIGVVTINMPRLGILAVDERDFFHRLGALMDLARDSLETKRKMLEGFTDRRLYPYSSFYLRGVKQRHGSYWANHFSTVGLVGMNEACQNLLGVDIGNETGWEFAMRALGFMRDRLQQFQRESGHFYNLEATPAEGTAYRLARLDRERFPEAIFANGRRPLGDGEEPFYTNSTHLPVNYTGDVFEVLDHQENLQTQYTGGTVVHVYVGEAIRESASVKAFVRKVCTNYRLPYFTLTPTFSVCPTHGYLAGEQSVCPQCHCETEVYSRVVGYLRPVQQWNGGKQEEFAMRRTFVMEEATARV